jgi:hypothetical protein
MSQLQVTGNAIFKTYVGIGNVAPIHKLQITQALDGSYPTLGTGKGALFIAGDTNLYGLYAGINTTDGNSWFQSMRNNTATAYNIVLNPAGGNVLIGTTTDNGSKLNVNGTARITGELTGTTSNFTNAGSGIGVAITNSSTGDGLKINHSAGRALNIQSTGANFGIIINNSTASTSVPFTIQKQGTNVVTMTDAGTLTLLSSLSATIATFSGSGNRPVTIDSNVNIKGDGGGWAMQHGFIGGSNTNRGGFGANGNADTLNYYYIGVFGAEKMIITSTGNTLIGTTTDSGEKLQVNGITKTAGLSLSGTTVSTSQTITSTFYMWIFNGSSGQTLTLYSASGHNNTHFIKNSSANSLTLAASNIETLTSNTTVGSITIPAYKTVQVISNGGAVWIVMTQS